MPKGKLVTRDVKKYKLEKVFQEYQNDFNFAELRGAHTRLVRYRGSVDAPLVLIGEAPGETEQRTGKPFVGRAGEILDAGLSASGIDTFYITNVVKFRPVGNRDPYSSEVELSIPYLLSELKIINPRVVVPLGKHALSVFKRNLTITHARGSSFHYRKMKMDFYIIPTWHPMAVGYDKMKEETFKRDLAKAKSFVDRLIQ